LVRFLRASVAKDGATKKKQRKKKKEKRKKQKENRKKKKKKKKEKCGVRGTRRAGRASGSARRLGVRTGGA
jgi:ribosomal protein L12E/L44/L45/RPP1/RPP2